MSKFTKTFDEQNQELIDFDKIFDKDNATHCAHRAMLLIKNRKAQMSEEGHEFLVDLNSCVFGVEQAILNRDSDETMMSAAIKYVEKIEAIAENAAGIN